MNIEDSIEILKNSKKLYLKEKIDSDILEEAIETLLTAYEKEKEKNKELSDKLTQKICKGVEEEILEEYRQTIISKDKEIEELKEVKWYYEISRVPKDKIKALIEEYDEILYYAETEEGMAELKDFEYDEAKYGKKTLQSLLEKE